MTPPHTARSTAFLRPLVGALAATGLAIGCTAADIETQAARTATLVREQSLQLEGAPPLTSISRVAATDSFVYVGQQGEQEILMYDSDGAYLRTIGRAGSGPGEFRELARFGVLHDTLWAIDWGMRRLTRFSEDGGVLNDLAFEPSVSGDDTAVSPFYLLPEVLVGNGSILGSGGTAARLLANGSVEEAPIMRWSVQTNSSDTLGWYSMKHYGLIPVGKNGGGFYWTQPVQTRSFTVYDGSDGKACVVERDQLARQQVAEIGVTCLGLTGDTVWQRAIAYAPVPIPDRVRDSLRDSRVRPLRQRFSADEVDAALYIPTHWPPVSEGIAGADGSIWLRGPSLDGNATYIVVSAAGDAITRITVPETQRVLWANHSTAWVQELDADDVPTLTRFVVEP